MCRRNVDIFNRKIVEKTIFNIENIKKKFIHFCKKRFKNSNNKNFKKRKRNKFNSIENRFNAITNSNKKFSNKKKQKIEKTNEIWRTWFVITVKKKHYKNVYFKSKKKIFKIIENFSHSDDSNKKKIKFKHVWTSLLIKFQKRNQKIVAFINSKIIRNFIWQIFMMKNQIFFTDSTFHDSTIINDIFLRIYSNYFFFMQTVDHNEKTYVKKLKIIKTNMMNVDIVLKIN